MNDRGPKTPPDGQLQVWPTGKRIAEVYEILRVLGYGGMGIVYVAYDLAMRRPVAMKVPLDRFVDDQTVRKQFLREAEAWTALVHPHIVRAFDVHDDRTTDYRPIICMEYCDGGSLADMIGRAGPLNPGDALDIALQICWALEFAHGKGHVHRDLKPANVLLTSDGRALLTDFGLVKSVQAEDLGLSPDRLTQAEQDLLRSISRIGGTPEYMAPEQWQGKANPQSDVYSFGVLLYQAVCNALPFTDERRLQLQVLHAVVPPRDPRHINPLIPDALAELILRCLAKRPRDRPYGFENVTACLEATRKAVQHRLPRRYYRRRPPTEDICRHDESTRAWALVRLALGCTRRGDYAQAERLLHEALSVFERLNDTYAQGACCTNLALIAQDRGDHDRAIQFFEQDLTVCRREGDKRAISICYTNLGISFYVKGDLDRALSMFEESLRMKEELGDEIGAANCYNNIAPIYRDRGQISRAAELHGRALRIAREYSDRTLEATCHLNLGIVHFRQGNVSQAFVDTREALRIAHEIGALNTEAMALTNLALLHDKTGNAEEAASGARDAIRLKNRLGVPIASSLHRIARE